jgi:hypothetical protein
VGVPSHDQQSKEKPRRDFTAHGAKQLQFSNSL